MVSKEEFTQIVTAAANRDISSTPDVWVETNPLLGSCAVVALLAQDLFGGELLRASLEGTEFAYGRSHYWNLLPDGAEVDFSEAQFEGRKPQLIGEIRTREYLLSNKDTRQRYETLKIFFWDTLANET